MHVHVHGYYELHWLFLPWLLGHQGAKASRTIVPVDGTLANQTSNIFKDRCMVMFKAMINCIGCTCLGSLGRATTCIENFISCCGAQGAKESRNLAPATLANET
jgi:hypothetical protein